MSSPGAKADPLKSIQQKLFVPGSRKRKLFGKPKLKGVLFVASKI